MKNSYSELIENNCANKIKFRIKLKLIYEIIFFNNKDKYVVAKRKVEPE